MYMIKIIIALHYAWIGIIVFMYSGHIKYIMREIGVILIEGGVYHTSGMDLNWKI